MGRPPATSDVDCTVPYHISEQDGPEKFDILCASVQIFLIMEALVLEVYSRRKISLQLAGRASSQLKDWSIRWLSQLREVAATKANEADCAQHFGACQVLSSYYYAVVLVSRPFLMYEIYRQFLHGSSPGAMPKLFSGKARLADACVDAACLMIDLVSDFIRGGVISRKVPLVV
jgi:hypothetical protein